MKKILVAALAVMLLLSCSKTDNTSYCPTWLGFTYTTGNYPNYTNGSPSRIIFHPGDSIHLTAHQKERGRQINLTYYTWTVCYDTLDNDNRRRHAILQYRQTTVYDGYTNGADDPVAHIRLPENALPTESGKPDTIQFVARYFYSGQGVIVENGSIINNNEYAGRITTQSGPTAGGASGNVYFHVEQ